MIASPLLSQLLTAGWLGLAAGLAVAIPLGPIGLLIVDRGLRHGRAVGLAAAAGVATTDLIYAVIALTATAWVSRVVEPVTRPAGYLAAAVIAGIGLRGLVQARDVPPSPTGPADVGRTVAASQARTFAAFAALTSINPATVLYFSVLALALGDRLGSLRARTAFVLGVALASLAWQSALAELGTRLGRQPRPDLQCRTRTVGSVLLLGFAVFVAVTAS